MPQLPKKIAKNVESAEAVHGFSLLTPGKYFARLLAVRADETNDGNPMWVAEFDQLHSVVDKSKAPGRQWWNLNLPLSEMPANYRNPDKFEQAQEMSLGRLKAFFEAFGYEVDSDTDEMLGEIAVISVGIRTIQNGARTGEKVNSVNDIQSADEFGDPSDFMGGTDDEEDTF